MANEVRLIKMCDATKVYNGIALYMAENAYLNDTALDVLKMVAGWLNEATTVDAVPVGHGYWIDGRVTDHIGRVVEHCIDCSVCDSVFKDDSREVVKNWKERFKFCPFCGARMDGDGDG